MPVHSVVEFHEIASVYHFFPKSSEKYFENQDCPTRKQNNNCVYPVEQLKFSSPQISAFLPEFSLKHPIVFLVSVTRALHTYSKNLPQTTGNQSGDLVMSWFFLWLGCAIVLVCIVEIFSSAPKIQARAL